MAGLTLRVRFYYMPRRAFSPFIVRHTLYHSTTRLHWLVCYLRAAATLVYNIFCCTR